MKRAAFIEWIDAELEADPELARAVADAVAEMKLEQQIVALRQKRGLSQRDLARRLGTSQPYVAKLESGRLQNLGVRTLVKCARALDATVSIRMAPVRRAARARAQGAAAVAPRQRKSARARAKASAR